MKTHRSYVETERTLSSYPYIENINNFREIFKNGMPYIIAIEEMLARKIQTENSCWLTVREQIFARKPPAWCCITPLNKTPYYVKEKPYKLKFKVILISSHLSFVKDVYNCYCPIKVLPLCRVLLPFSHGKVRFLEAGFQLLISENRMEEKSLSQKTSICS